MLALKTITLSSPGFKNRASCRSLHFKVLKANTRCKMDDTMRQSHTNWKDDLRVDRLYKKLCNEMFWYCLMHMQCSLLCLFWVASFIKVALKFVWSEYEKPYQKMGVPNCVHLCQWPLAAFERCEQWLASHLKKRQCQRDFRGLGTPDPWNVQHELLERGGNGASGGCSLGKLCPVSDQPHRSHRSGH